MVLTVRRGLIYMPISEDEFESWCWRNGGETYEEPPAGPGIVCRFPDAETPDRVAYLPDIEGFQIYTRGQFYTAISLHQQTDSWIDDDDQLHVDTEDVRAVIDPT
jgi:hypothetical protein